MPEHRTAPSPTLTDLLLDKAGVGLCLVAPDGTVLRANTEWLRSTGFTAEQVIGEDIVELFPATRDMALATHARARAGHRVEVPRHAQVVNDRETWWEGSIEPVPMEGGTGLLITAREVLPRNDGGAAASSGLASELLELGDAFCELDAGYRVARVNARQEQLTGIPRAQSVGKTHWELWPESARPDSPWWREYHRCMEERVPVAFVNYYAPLDLWSSVTAYPTSSGGIAIFFRDVTAQKRAEEELRRSEARLRLALDSARMVAWEYDPATHAVTLSENAEEVLELPRRHENSEQGYGLIHPDDVERHRALVTGAIASGGRYLSVYRHAHDGNPIWLEEHGRAVVDETGKTVRLVGVVQNVTAREDAEVALRESEARLQLAVEAGELGTWDLDLVTGKVVRSLRHDQIFGYEEVQPEWSVEHALKHILPEDRQKVQDAHAPAPGKQRMYVEGRLHKADGGIRWVMSTGRFQHDDQGRPIRLTGICADITERKRAEEVLREANARLEEADKRKDEFLGMLSHELRNPLAPIRNSTYILRNTPAGSEHAERARIVIERQTDHLTRLVDDLLDVTRIARSKIELRRSRVDLRAVVLHAGDDFRLTMQDRGITFRTSVPDAEVWADADATRITQIVGNLLHNASKFTRSGDEVVLSLQASAANAEIRVRDTGVGIDAALLPRIFEPFVQGERTLARTEGGLGLGLALVKGIAELHGGAVRAESAGKGKGAEFVVRLPLVEPSTTRVVASGHVQPGNGGRRVLVVDDNADAAESLADLVGMLGHETEIAYDGPSAVEKARTTRPEIVLCDIGLPGMSGYEVARAVRAQGRPVQLVAVSGYAQPEDVRRAIEAGFDAHIAKPPDPAQIERLLA